MACYAAPFIQSGVSLKLLRHEDLQTCHVTSPMGMLGLVPKCVKTRRGISEMVRFVTLLKAPSNLIHHAVSPSRGGHMRNNRFNEAQIAAVLNEWPSRGDDVNRSAQPRRQREDAISLAEEPRQDTGRRG